tara:strand:+ start:362 stop:532 length:171 start_codon:yes stop_codon:yes gene_type:complete
MKINTKIRKKVIKIMINRWEKIQSEISPYGFEDPMKYYYLIDYWEDILNELQNKKK